VPASLFGDGAPRLLCSLLDIQEDTRLIAWPGLQLTAEEHVVATLIEEEARGGEVRGTRGARGEGRARGGGSRTGGPIKTRVVVLVEDKEAKSAATEDDVYLLRVPMGCLVLFRSDAVHVGALNPCLLSHWRLHVYQPSEGFSEFGLIKDATNMAW